ncbi:MAG: prohibitin family protein [Pseudomonadales bacterium]|jgi:regulator of protease activity HflC (stomatin/prohibitin superfamily)|nr:prohibitin family protein [Pseudomonadales bacterium]
MGFIIGTPIVALIVSAAFALHFGKQREPSLKAGAMTFITVCAISLLLASLQTVKQSTVGVVTVFGKIQDEVLSAGLHFILPWAQVHSVKVGVQVIRANQAEASSKDLQNVYTTITANYSVAPERARALFAMSPSLTYETDYLVPGLYETFKAVTSHYIAEELITQRAAVSENMTQSLQTKLAQYGVTVRDLNITDFSFSSEFNKAIEAKVTAGQYAEKAQRDLQRIQVEAQQKIAEAEGQARAIAIQAEAIQVNGGAEYIQLQAINKWDGRLPAYLAPNTPLPFIGVAGGAGDR